MTTFLLIPGAGGDAWYWHRLIPEIADRGHTGVAVELPADDSTAGLDRYAEAVVEAGHAEGTWLWWLSPWAASQLHWCATDCP